MLICCALRVSGFPASASNVDRRNWSQLKRAGYRLYTEATKLTGYSLGVPSGSHG